MSKKTLVDMLQELFTTTRDLADKKHGEDRVADAEASAREAMALLKVRRDNIRIERQRSRE
jgi:hypothetical protein